MAETPTPRVTPAHALGIYAEPLADGRRVIVVGDSSDGLGERLIELGARTVHVYDADAERASRSASSAPRALTIRALPAGDFDVRDGAFDLALVPDLGAIKDPAALLSRLRRLVGNEGATLVAARNPEAPARGQATRALDYYELYDMVALQFASVRMIGQVPFSGVALAELGDTDAEPQVSVDTQLVSEADPPEAFIALASQRDVRLDAYAIVQLPTSSSVTGASAVIGVANDTAEGELAAARVAVAEAQLRAELLEAQLDEQRALLAKQERASRPDVVTDRNGAHATKLRDAETRAGDEHVRAERLALDLRKLEEELQRQRERVVRLTRELDEEKRARTKAELELGAARKSPELASARERVSYLEEALRAAEDVVGALQTRSAELEIALADNEKSREQIVVLVEDLEAARAQAQVNAETTAQLQVAIARLADAERRAALLEQELARHGEAHGQELVEIEAALRDRARAIKMLEDELVRRERMVQELVAALEEAHHTLHEPHQTPAERIDTPLSHEHVEALKTEVESRNEALRELREREAKLMAENKTLRAKLDALALEAARREGDVQTSAWRIAELERALTASSTASSDAPPSVAASAGGDAQPGVLERELASAKSELASAEEQIRVLKQALAQEHDALRKSANGEELARARTELQRQAVLIEQLSRELDAKDRARNAPAARDA